MRESARSGTGSNRHCWTPTPWQLRAPALGANETPPAPHAGQWVHGEGTHHLKSAGEKNCPPSPVLPREARSHPSQLWDELCQEASAVGSAPDVWAPRS